MCYVSPSCPFLSFCASCLRCLCFFRRGFVLVQHVRLGYSWYRRNRSCILLAFCWTSGFIAGFLFYNYNLHTLSSLMRRIVFTPVSIVGLTLTFLLPFLFSAFAVFNHTPIWIFPISAYKAFSFSIVSIGLV